MGLSMWKANLFDQGMLKEGEKEPRRRVRTKRPDQLRRQFA